MNISINVDPLNQLGRPSPSVLKEMGFSWVRMVARPGAEWYASQCIQSGLNIILLLARESFNSIPIPEQVASYARYFPATIWQIGNEMDQQGESSWSMTQDDYRGLVYSCVNSIHSVNPDAKIISGGLASGNPSWWTLDDLPIDGIAVHPYAKSAQEASVLLDQYRQVSSKPIYVTEWYRPPSEIQDFLEMLDGVELSCYFCYSDAMVMGFGLLDTNGNPKPEYWALREAMRQMGQLTDKVKLLETQQALTVAVMKLILQGRWTGEWPHAEGFLKAIDPADTGWSVSVPKC